MRSINLSRRDWLKASAVGIIGSLTPFALPKAVLAAHDHFSRPGLDFTLEDVRLRPGSRNRSFLFFHPRTGRITTQNERRAMIEMRTNVGVWRTIRHVKRMAAEGPANLRADLQEHVDRAIALSLQSMRRYNLKSKNKLSSGSGHFLIKAPYSLAQRFALHAADILSTAVNLNPAWADKNFDPEVLTFIGIRINNGVVEEIPAVEPEKEGGRAANGSTGMLGGLRADQTFQPLADRMTALLDAVDRSHDAWVQAIKDNAPTAKLDELVHLHHREHRELEFLARTHDELSLLALQHHMHDIDPLHTKDQVVALADRSNKVHKEWVRGVKERNLRKAWLAGLNHSGVHIMLGVAGVEIKEE